jgi:HlyD family secretion protein
LLISQLYLDSNMKTIAPVRQRLVSSTKDGLADFLSNKKLVKISSVAIGVIVLAIISGNFLCNKKQTLAKATPAPVLTVTSKPAGMEPLVRLLSVHGSVSTWDPISVGATAAALEVKYVLVEEGALVKKGQVLARLDSAQLQAQIESERARLAAGLANINKSIQPNRPEDINGLFAAVAQAQASVEDQQAALLQAQANVMNARNNLKRYQYLKSEGAVSAQEAEDRETAAQVYEAGVGSAEKKILKHR